MSSSSSSTGHTVNSRVGEIAPSILPVEADYHVLASPSSSVTIHPPKPDQKILQKYLAAGMANAGGTGGSGRRKQKKVVNKFFNPVAGRPNPRNNISVEQSIRVELWDYGLAFGTSVSAPVYYGFAFSLNGFSGYSAYTALFDQYKFESIEVWIEPTTTNATGGNLLATCIDLDDANVPTAIQQVADHQQSMVGTGQAGRYTKWEPHVAIAAYGGVTFTSYGNSPPVWIDSGSSTVQHYGYKIAALSPGVVINYQLSVRAVVRFRAPGIS